MTLKWSTVDQLKAEYDKLYAEWKMKNDACNKAYAITIPQLEAEVDRLKGALANANRKVDNLIARADANNSCSLRREVQMGREIATVESQRDLAEARVTALRAALEKYGQHDTDGYCPEYSEEYTGCPKARDEGPCTCGLDTALEEKP